MTSAMNTMLRSLLLCVPMLAILITASPIWLVAQHGVPNQVEFSRGDSLRGTLSPLRTCYDVHFYHLDIEIYPEERLLNGTVDFHFSVIHDFDRLQFDLFDNLNVDKIRFRGQELSFTRAYHAVFVDFPTVVPAGSLEKFTVYYSGKPIEAKRAPWDGGIDYQRDKNNNHWIATACQKIGASVWWPTKDHQSDKPDSVLISVSVPSHLTNVSNGRFRGSETLANGFTRYDWFVSNPINNYNVALNIGDYRQYNDSYWGENGKLDIDYWLLNEVNDTQALDHLRLNVHRMLDAFEFWFGPYPFYADGYKIIQTSHLGMEHQSAIAYGNQFQNGYLGRDLSGTGWGLHWDFIVIHESGHEWFGNSITSNDLADMWIHEAFTNYSESLFIEYHYGKEAAVEYLYGNRHNIQNEAPIQGVYGVNHEGSLDMYNKGGVFLHMIRTLFDDDSLWRTILREMNQEFYHTTVDYEDVVNFFNRFALYKLDKTFAQYVQHASLPILEFSHDQEGIIYARWNADVEDFDMPIALRAGEGAYEIFQPSSEFVRVNLPNLTRENLDVDMVNFYIGGIKWVN